MNRIKKLLFCAKLGNLGVVLLACLAIMVAGCDTDGLKSAEKLYNEGKYDKALPKFMKDVDSYRSRLNGKYSSLDSARQDAAKYSEKCYFAGMCQKQLGDTAKASEMFRLAATAKFPITETYKVSEEVYVTGGYKDVWVDGYYKDVYIDGHYEEVWVEGYNQETWVDGHYDSDGNWIDGHTEQKWVDGHYDNKWIEGYNDRRWVEGRYESQWVPAHYETVWHTKERKAEISNNSQYVSLASSELGSSAPVSNKESGSVSQTPASDQAEIAESAVRIKEIRDSIDALQLRRQELVESGNTADMAAIDAEIARLTKALSEVQAK
ncbi:MAG: hypothetical protein CVV64_20480 [Candidatus Wallbacteria bacterium HGW-Wallbacteria-1]|jgi:tetratricopeptide (TPR) repeat protein|uniref:Lipoprotein n=1 Tax=Candidatus Wallbacteria bacterium HGW-Wallbacteria-1 TaxID=2013854 RepID=A0A2N1PI80_9BACT|nr:MAG: hypothetical protein CVV64_20480 [Candidatus Wallbacteria bacterium HGW-Wallbacteria-1]